MYRRLALGHHVALALTLDPAAFGLGGGGGGGGVAPHHQQHFLGGPPPLPDCKFMGADAAVAPLR